MLTERKNPLTDSKGWRAEAYRRIVNERPDFFEQVTNYCLLGATEAQLGFFFGYDNSMWLYWMKHSQELRDAVDAGSHVADAKVASALHKRATGYEYTRQKIVVNKQGHAEVFDIVEHTPPDTMAAKFWLTNRSANWSDKQEHEHRGDVQVDHNVTIEFISSKPVSVLDITPLPPQSLSSDNDADL